MELFSQGQYFPPEGCTVFSENNSSTLYIYGGARAAKPGHWALSNYLFQIQTEKFDKTESSASFHQVLSFKMFNHTTSKTSQFTKLFGANGLTEHSSSDYFEGFTVNGKDLDCPNEKQFLSNEIRILETASEMTFRTVIVRTGEGGNIQLTNIKKAETVQMGDFPEPSYGSSLVRIPEMDGSGLKAAVKIGGSVLKNRTLLYLEFLFSGVKMWEEESSSEVHILEYNVKDRVFKWKLVNVHGLEPRALHSAVKIDRFIYIFGGLDLKNGRRYPFLPVRINIYDWNVSTIESTGFGGFLSGAASLPCAEKVYFVGGYMEEKVGDGDKPCDTISEVTFSSQGKVWSHLIETIFWIQSILSQIDSYIL